MKIFLLNSFADFISLSSNSIEFHNFGNKAEGKYSRVLKRTAQVHIILFYLVQLKN